MCIANIGLKLHKISNTKAMHSQIKAQSFAKLNWNRLSRHALVKCNPILKFKPLSGVSHTLNLMPFYSLWVGHSAKTIFIAYFGMKKVTISNT